MIDLKELKRLAEGATPFGELPCPENVYIFGNDHKSIVAEIRDLHDGDGEMKQEKANHDFINAANSSTILQLIKEHQEMREALDTIENEPSQKHWKFNEDGTTTNIFAAWARGLARQTLEGVSK